MIEQGRRIVLKYPRGRSAKKKANQTGTVIAVSNDLMIVKFEDKDEVICAKSEVALIIEVF